MKKIIFIVLLILLTACTNNVNNTNNDLIENEGVEKESKKNSIEGAEIDRTGILSGEIITDGIYGKSGKYFLYFIPDKETREIIYQDHPLEIGESVPLEFEDLSLIKDLPKELGIYKVEIDADFSVNKWAAKLKSIKLTDDIGTVEYEGKTYETNDLDENVQPKDSVCGLIVENVRRFDGGGVIIFFAGEIESGGYYNVYPGGDVFQYNKVGKIIAEKEYKKNFPTYKGKGNNFSVWFTETNELYEELANFSAIGRGKFKSSNYYLVYNYGIGAGPGEILSEIVSLDENYKGLFEYNENEIRIMGFDDDYLIAVENKIDGLEVAESTYYFVALGEFSKIKIASSDGESGYMFEKSNEDKSNKNYTDFKMTNQPYGNSSNPQRSHTIGYRYFNNDISSSGKDYLTKDVNYGTFKYGDNKVEVYEGDAFLGMVAEDISVVYRCTEDFPEELERIRIKFTGETTLTGKLNVSVDDEFGYQVYFVADSESASKLPHHMKDTRDGSGFRFSNENIKEILGEEPFSKECEITINDYNIHYAATEASNTAELVSVKYND
ncbi:MAG: hypothetical protein AAGU76_04635 [Sedimentibacter sp.]|uniref:hypothetical protein n=1 Tax=Sedimentibacter sp. TaxID=1960295 RepID=UPI0031587E64